MKVSVLLELELHQSATDITDEAFDTWAWALERQVEQLDLIEKANVIDVTFPEETA